MASEEPSLTTHGNTGQTRQIRISRGATVMATDGSLGAVHQIIMDQHTGELQALVVATGDVRQLEVPASHVVRSDGDTVYLDVSLAELRLHPEMARVYNPDQYIPVRENPILPPSEAGDEARFTERPVVTNIERDAVGVVVPEPSTRKDDMVASMTTPEPEHYIPETPPPAVEAPMPAQPNAEPTVADTHVVTNEGGETEMEPAPHGAVNPRTGSIAGAIAAESAPTDAISAPVTAANQAGDTDDAGDADNETPIVTPAERDAVEAAPEPVAMSVEPDSEPAYEPDVPPADDPANAAVPPLEEELAASAPDAPPEGPPVTMFVVEGDEVLAPPVDKADRDAIDGSVGLENATRDAGTESDVPAEEEEEAEVVEGSLPPVNPANPGATSDTLHSGQNTVSRVLNESRQSRTGNGPAAMNRRGWGRQGLTSSSSEMYGSRMTWIPAVALGVLIVGLATWSTIRAIRRGRRKAVKAARNARMNVRESMLGAGRSAADMAQTMRANAQQVMTNAQQMVSGPQSMANDAIGNFNDIPARYRWFRRGMRVGSRMERLRGRLS